ncbi:hypothetical protein CWO91_30280 [Bradyrhizobium genosp. SA-3]|nr:hypothetical protein CWO91_30280 [Bradyrhizobium genosp. SA-3]
MLSNRHLVQQASLRALSLVFGLLGALWSVAALPSFWLTASAREVSARIIADDRFKPGVLPSLLTRMTAAPRPSIAQPEFAQFEALLTLRTAEEAAQRKSLGEADREIEGAENKLRAALFVIPTDSFLWLMLYSVTNARTGFDQRNLGYLGQSYASGPNEGWIALRRNRVALAAFVLLGDVTQNLVVSEFAELVDSDFTESAALNLMGAGWAQRDRLLTALRDVDVASKQLLYNRLSAEGIKLNIPGVAYDERPWR